jgi:hypothetical protein
LPDLSEGVLKGKNGTESGFMRFFDFVSGKLGNQPELTHKILIDSIEIKSAR